MKYLILAIMLMSPLASADYEKGDWTNWGKDSSYRVIDGEIEFQVSKYQFIQNSNKMVRHCKEKAAEMAAEAGVTIKRRITIDHINRSPLSAVSVCYAYAEVKS